MNLEFYNQIKNSSAHTKSRLDNANFVSQNLNLLPELIAFSFNVNDMQHIRACAVLDKVFELQLGLSFQFIDLICNDLHKLKDDSAIRSISRFLMFLTQDNSKKNYLTINQLEKITEASFDWLIEDYRVAVKHHAVNTLVETGKISNWIYPELRTILEKEIEFPSPGYRNIVKKFLKMI